MISYEIPQFDQLDAGITTLSVPIVADAVQLGALNFASMTRLAVNAGGAHLTIGREDGVPLQIQAVSDNEMLAVFRKPILGLPVVELVLHKGEQDGVWSVKIGPDVQVREPQALGEFLATVAVFSLEKQLKDARRLAAQILINRMLAEERVLYGSV